MLIPTPEEYAAITRIDFNVFAERAFVELNGAAPYSDNFHLAVIGAELEGVRLGDERRIAFALPPRSLKSILISVAYPAWLLGHDPTTKIICASYGQKLAETFARWTRQVMRSDWYKELYPATRLSPDHQAVGDFNTTAGGYRYASSVGGAITGTGADIIIVDDPTKPEDALSDVKRKEANLWAQHTLFTRLNDKINGKIILVMQRLHEDDMIGHVAELCNMKLIAFPAIAQEDEDYVIKTPFGMRRHSRKEGEALHPTREPLEVLDAIRKAVGPQFFSAQYLQMPAPPGGSIVRREWFSCFDPANPPPFDETLQSWDTASRSDELSDYSVCTSWGRKGRQLYLLSVFRKKLNWPDLKRAIIQQASIFGASKVYIEDASSGIGLIQDLKSDGFYKVEAVKPKGEKPMRLRNVSAIVEAGQIFLPLQAPWLEDFLHELTMFPAGRYDDQVDSFSQALSKAFLDVSPSKGFHDMVREDNALGPRRKRLLIRVNCDDKAMQFQLHGGRCPKREEDGSFLISEEEAEYMAAILYRV
jgi:predicted phage terminase large subunit-like protein